MNSAHSPEVSGRSSLAGFVVAGGIGFLVDAGVLEALVAVTQLHPNVARILSFLCASFVTWRINRRYTFAAPAGRGSLGEWFRYVSASGAGALANYLAFVITLLGSESARSHPALGVAVGSLVGMGINYVLYRFVVFASKPGPKCE